MTDRTSESRERLLDAAADLIARGGYHGTGVNAVLAASAVPNGSLYHHFPGGKDELIAATMLRIGEQTAAAITELLAAGPDAAVVAMFDAGIARVRADDYDAGCRIATPLADAGPDATAVRAAAEVAFGQWEQAISAGLVAQGWTEETARSTAVVTVALYEGAVLLARAERSSAPLVDAREAARELVAARAPTPPRRRGRVS